MAAAARHNSLDSAMIIVIIITGDAILSGCKRQLSVTRAALDTEYRVADTNVCKNYRV